MDYPVRFAGNAHRAACDGSVGVDTAGSVGLQGGAGKVGESFGYLIDGVICPLVKARCRFQPWVGRFHSGDLGSGPRDDGVREGGRQFIKATLYFEGVEASDGKDAGTAVAAAAPAGNLPQQ